MRKIVLVLMCLLFCFGLVAYQNLKYDYDYCFVVQPSCGPIGMGAMNRKMYNKKRNLVGEFQITSNFLQQDNPVFEIVIQNFTDCSFDFNGSFSRGCGNTPIKLISLGTGPTVRPHSTHRIRINLPCKKEYVNQLTFQAESTFLTNCPDETERIKAEQMKKQQEEQLRKQQEQQQQLERERQERKKRQEAEDQQLWEKRQEEIKKEKEREAEEAEKERERQMELEKQKNEATVQAIGAAWDMMSNIGHKSSITGFMGIKGGMLGISDPTIWSAGLYADLMLNHFFAFSCDVDAVIINNGYESKFNVIGWLGGNVVIGLDKKMDNDILIGCSVGLKFIEDNYFYVRINAGVDLKRLRIMGYFFPDGGGIGFSLGYSFDK